MGSAKVLVSDKLSDNGLEILKKTPGIEVVYKTGMPEAELCQVIADCDALVVRSSTEVTAKVLEHAKRLKVVGRAGIGVDNVDVPAASKSGVIVMNTPTGNAVTTAEHAIALLMSLARMIPQATASMRGGKWEKSKFQGRELAGKTFGLVGAGNIGRIVADRALGLKLNVIASDPVLTREKATKLGIELVELDELFSRADFISIHAPLTNDTKNMVSDAAFGKMKKGVLIVNAARGGIVDEDALLRAIESGKVAGAALDVFSEEPIPADHPLLKVDKIICTPHLGASTAEAQERVAIEIAEQVVQFLQHGIVKNAVNVANVAPEIAEQLAPYTRCATRLGSLLAQLENLKPTEFRVTCTGEAGELGVRPIAHAALAGYLERQLGEPVNPVRAPFEAEERGMSVVEVREPNHGRYRTAIQIQVKGERGTHTVTGTVGAKQEPRILSLDGYTLDAILEGRTLVMRNQDRPGVIGAVGTILGKRNINVSRMQVGLDENKHEALALWNVDGSVPKEALDELRKLENVSLVLAVEL